MSELQIKTDIIGQLKLFRSSTFIDPYAFIQEAIQNSQRAKASKLQVLTDVHSDGSYEITFIDDGAGLSDPEDLFTLTKTGWDNDTIESEQPFGIGFFSCMAMANKVEVESKGKKYSFDYEEIMATGTPSVKVEDSSFEDGFMVTLKSFVPDFNIHTFIVRFKEAAKLCLSLKCSIDGESILPVDYLRPPETLKHYRKVRFGTVNGWIGPSSSSWEGAIKIYHQDRFVTDLPFPGIIGALSVGLADLTLRAPDRRSIIEDQKYQDFKSTLRESFVKPLLIKMIQDPELNVYQTDIANMYLSVDDYADKLRYVMISSLDTVDRLANLDEYDLRHMTREELLDLIESTPDPQEIEEPVDLIERTIEFKPSNRAINTGSVYSAPLASSYDNPYVGPVKEVKAKSKALRTLNNLAKKRVLYYVTPRDLATHRNIIGEALNAGIPIVLARTELEKRSLESKLRAIRVSDVTYAKKLEIRVTPDKASLKARRVGRLIGYLLKKMEIENIDIKLGNIEARHNILLSGDVVASTPTRLSIARENNTIYIDTTSVNRSRVLNMSDDRVDIGELFFLMGRFDELREALTGLIKCDVSDVDSYIIKSLASIEASWIVTNRIAQEESPSNEP